MPPRVQRLSLTGSDAPSRLLTLSPGFSDSEAHVPTPAPWLTPPASGLCLVYGSASRVSPHTMHRAPDCHATRTSMVLFTPLSPRSQS